jgi:hypothetical protein
MVATRLTLKRLIALAVLALMALSIALGRQRPTPVGIRRPSPPRYHVLSSYEMYHTNLPIQLLDTQTGRVQPLARPPGDAIDCTACSPWTDERGQAQLVARWSRIAKREIGNSAEAFGLARFTVPEGKIIERIPLETLPASRPCWFPGEAARILFAGGDGQLYRYDFDEGPGRPIDRMKDPRPVQHVPWRTTTPVPPRLFISTPSWPTDPRLGGRILVSIMDYSRTAERKNLQGVQLWWLELDPTGTAIAAAGRMETPAAAASGTIDEDERLPVLATAPGGTLVMAYLASAGDHWGWQLRLAEVMIDPARGSPIVTPGTVRTLALGCIATTPFFSPDGRWVHAVVTAESDPDRIARFDVAEVLAGRSAPTARGASTCAR